MKLAFCPTLENLYRAREAVGRSGKPFRMTGGLSTVNNLATIREVMLELKPERTMEVGMACGGSALTIAVTHRDLKHLPTRQHVAIDGFQLTKYDDVGRLKLEEAGLSGYVEVREQLSAVALPKIVEENLKFGLVYIDGSHRFEDVFCDFYFVRQLVEVGGIIFFDDSSDPRVMKVIRFIQSNLRDYFEQIPIFKYREPSLLNRVKYSIAEALHKTQLSIFRKIKDGDRPCEAPLRSF